MHSLAPTPIPMCFFNKKAGETSNVPMSLQQLFARMIASFYNSDGELGRPKNSKAR